MSRFRILYREFLFRVVDLELIAPEGDMSKLLGQFAALLISLSLCFTLLGSFLAGSVLPPAARLMAVWTGEHFLIATTMLVVGIFAVLSWNSAFPDRRDVLVLAPLPIRGGTIFLAKVAAVASALAVTVLALHSVATLTWPYALAVQSAALNAPLLTYDAALPPVDAGSMQSVLDRDLSAAQKPGGALGPGTGAGVAIGVSRNGVRRILAYGTAQPDSIFEIGSVSKTFTALILAQMVAQGAVTLDEPVRALLPTGTVDPPGGPEITLLDLATHHSGLPAMPDNYPIGGENPGARYHAADLYRFLRERGVGKSGIPEFEYSNLGFALLGTALASRANATYASLLYEEVTAPLGLRDTTLSLSAAQQRRLIQAYNLSHRPVPAMDLDALAPAGAIRSTAGDLLTYLEAHLHPELLPSPTLAAAIQNTHQLRADAGETMRIGLSWVYDRNKGFYWHNGLISGYTSYALFDPHHDYALVVLLNNLGFLSGLLPDHIRQRFAGEPAISLGNVAIPGSAGVLTLPRSFAAYSVSMFAAGIFVFCAVLGMQGLAAQVLPRRYFLRLSSWMQLTAFCLFVAGYFLEPQPQAAFGDASNFRLLSWLPSYLFLALFQQLNGTLHPALAPFAHRAWIALAITAAGTAFVYLLSYFRTLRQIVEEPDILPSTRSANWLPRFGSPMHTAIARFSIRTLIRSRQHRVILAFYSGIGFGVSILYLKTPVAQQKILASAAGAPWQQAAIPLLVSSIVMAACWVLGIRMVFALPLELPANWVFRILPLGAAPECLVATRCAFYLVALAPPLLVATAAFLWVWPWQPAAGHLAVLALFSLTLAELTLHNFQKLPFTCSYLPGKTNLHVTFSFCVLGFQFMVLWAAGFESRAIAQPSGLARLLVVLVLAAAWARRRATMSARSEIAALRFDETPDPAIFALEIRKDGALPG